MISPNFTWISQVFSLIAARPYCTDIHRWSLQGKSVVMLSQNNCGARLLGSQTLHAVSWLGAVTAHWHGFLLVGHSLLHTRMLDVVLGPLEKSQKHRMPCRNKGDLMHLWLWQDFHRTYLWSSCRLEPISGVTCCRELWEGAGSKLHLYVSESRWTRRGSFLFSILHSSTKIKRLILRHGSNKGLEYHPLVMCPHSYMPWHSLCLLILPACVAKSPLKGQESCCKLGQNCWKYLHPPAGGIRMSSVDQGVPRKEAGKGWYSCLPTARIITVRAQLRSSHKSADL